MNIILYLYVTIIMLIKNISTDFFEVELLLFKDNLTIESYKEYETRNVTKNNATYVHYKTGKQCPTNEPVDFGRCYRINSAGKLILNEVDVDKNKELLYSTVYSQARRSLLYTLKAIDLNERGIRKDTVFDLSDYSTSMKANYHKYYLYPYYWESIVDYWTRTKVLLLSCINDNPKLIMKQRRVNDICNMRNFDWYDNLKSFKPSENETMESYSMRMTKYDRIPLADLLLKKFYFDSYAKRRTKNSIKLPSNFHRKFEENILQCITLCLFSNNDRSASSLSKLYTYKTPNLNESSSYQNDNITAEYNICQQYQDAFNTSIEHSNNLQGNPIIMYKDDTTPHLDVGSSYQHENIPYTTATMYENSSSQYPPPYVNYMSQNILDITREQQKGANTMHSMNDDPYNLIGSSSHQYQNFYVENTKQNIFGSSSQYWNQPEKTANIRNNIDDTTPTYNFDEDFIIQQQILDGNNSLQNNLDDFLNEEVDLDEITNIISSIDDIIPDHKK